MSHRKFQHDFWMLRPSGGARLGQQHWFAKKLTCETTKAEYQCVPSLCRFPDDSVERGANIRIEREEMCIGALPQMLVKGFDRSAEWALH